MKILVITDLYPIEDNEIHTPKTIYNFVQSWKNQGHEVKVIKPNFILNSFLRKKPFYKSSIYGDIENINYWMPFWGKLGNKVKSVNLKHLPTAHSSNPEGEMWDVVIAHMPSGLIFANKLGLKFSAGVHASDLKVLTNPIYSIYFKNELENAYKNANKIACRSFALKDKFLKLYPQYENKTFVAASGVNKNYIVKREWQNKDTLKVLTCGQFIKRKNIDMVIKACKELQDVELTVIGCGKEEHSLKKISSRTIFTGQLSHNKVIEKMRESDIFILPSVNETFGIVYLEAMASGCITVCTKNDGVDGIIKDGENGFTVEPNVENIKKVIKEIKNSNNHTILENTYKTILCYTDDKSAEVYLKNLIC